MKQQFHISPEGIRRIKKKTMRQFIPLFLVFAVLAFVSWRFILRPSLYFDNPKRWIPGILLVTMAALFFLFYVYKAFKSAQRLDNLQVETDDLFITSLNFLGTKLTIAYTDIVKVEKIKDSYYLKTADWQQFIELYPETENREQLLELIYRKRPDLRPVA